MQEQAITQYLYHLVETGQLAHAYALTGSHYPSKQQVVVSLIQALVCTNKTSQGEPCHQCDACLRAKNGQIADVYMLKPAGTVIKVDQVRQINEWLATKPLETYFKLVVIEQAETLNLNAANAMLKLLEEPDPHRYLLLMVPEMSDLLPTIQSRLQELPIPVPTSAQQVADWRAQGVSEFHGRLWSALPDQVAEYWMAEYDEAAVDQWIKALDRFYQYLYTGNDQGIVYIQTRLKKQLDSRWCRVSLDYLIGFNYQVMNALTESEAPSYYAVEQLIQSDGAKLHQVLCLNDLLLEAMERLEANVSAQLTLERLVLRAEDALANHNA